MGIPILWLNLRITQHIKGSKTRTSVLDVLSSADSRERFLHIKLVVLLIMWIMFVPLIPHWHDSIVLFISPRLWYHRQHPIKKDHGMPWQSWKTRRNAARSQGPKAIHSGDSSATPGGGNSCTCRLWSEVRSWEKHILDRRLDSDLASVSQQLGWNGRVSSNFMPFPNTIWHMNIVRKSYVSQSVALNKPFTWHHGNFSQKWVCLILGYPKMQSWVNSSPFKWSQPGC